MQGTESEWRKVSGRRPLLPTGGLSIEAGPQAESWEGRHQKSECVGEPHPQAGLCMEPGASSPASSTKSCGTHTVTQVTPAEHLEAT